MKCKKCSRGEIAAMDTLGTEKWSSPVLFRFSRFSKAYRARLLLGLKDLQSFCRHEVGRSLSHVIGNADVADRVLGNYVMQRHNNTSGKSLSLVKHALLGCQHVRPSVGRTKGGSTAATAAYTPLVHDGGAFEGKGSDRKGS